MKFDELLEAPMGFGSTLKTAAKAINPFSLSGRKQAQGQLSTGKTANQIYGEFYKWLGTSGAPADTDSVVAFLQQNGYSQQAIQAAQSKFPQAPAADQTQTQQPPADNKVEPTLDNPTQPQKLTPDQIAAQKSQRKQNISNLKKNPNQNGFSNWAKSGGVNPGVDPNAPSVQKNWRESRIMEGVALNKDQLSAIFTSVAQAGSAPTTGQSSAGNATVQPSYNQSTAGSRNQKAPPVQRPQLTVDSVVEFYKTLDTNGKQQLKDAIATVDQGAVDQNQPKLSPDEYISRIGAEPTPESYSRFLGRSL